MFSFFLYNVQIFSIVLLRITTQQYETRFITAYKRPTVGLERLPQWERNSPIIPRWS